MTATTDSKALYRAFLACLIVASLPVKNLAYVTPAVYLLIMWAHGERGVACRAAMLSAVILFISYFAVLWDHLSGQAVNFPGPWFGLLTYSPLIVLLCETFNRTVDTADYERFAKACVWFILLQSAVGVFQFVATGNADAVCGTLGLLDGFRQSITIAQVYFTFIIFGMILFLVPVATHWTYRLAIGVGALICVLAQSGHQTIFFVLVLIASSIVRVSRIGTLVRSIVSAIVITLLVLEFYPNTTWLAREWFRKVTDESTSPKLLVCEGAISILEQPKNLLIGTGLGQYSSRAALISSNKYLNVTLPQMLTGKSEYFNDHIEPSLELFASVGEGSAIAQPYMSVLSLLVELGPVLFFVLVGVVCYATYRSARLMMCNGGEPGWLGFTMMVGTLFFVLCCLIENYAEFAQAIFVPFILYIVAGSRAATLVREGSAGQLAATRSFERAPKTRRAIATPLAAH